MIPGIFSDASSEKWPLANIVQSFYSLSGTFFFCLSLRIEFLLKSVNQSDSEYPKDAGLIIKPPWQTLGIPCAIAPIGQLSCLYPRLFKET